MIHLLHLLVEEGAKVEKVSRYSPIISQGGGGINLNKCDYNFFFVCCHVYFRQKKVSSEIHGRNRVSTMNIAGDFFLTIIYMKLIMKKLESYLFKFIPGRSPETARFTGLLLVKANIERIDAPTAHNIPSSSIYPRHSL